MKIMIPTNDDKETICPSFGRAPFFLLHDSEKDETLFLDNPAAEAQGGAGIKAAQFVCDNDADCIITIRCGENAAEVFKAAEIKIYKNESLDAMENVKLLIDNKLELLTKFHAGYHGLK